MIHRAPVARLSRLLEHDGPKGVVPRALAAVWERAANPVRPVTLPRAARVIGVGGPTLGGSFKTPFVLALATALTKRGTPVAVAVHGYRARTRTPRRVHPEDDVRGVGDDALFLARELAAFGVPVIAGNPWSDVIALAASLSPTVIVDGLLQATPRRLDWSALVFDYAKPWGSAHCPPAGDLRASASALCRAADDRVSVVDAVLPCETAGSLHATSDIAAVEAPGSEMVALDVIARRRIGLVTAIARPERVVTALSLRGIHPVEIRVFGDHRRLPERRGYRERRGDLDLWVTTGKCATKLGPSYEGKPVRVLEHRLALSPAVIDRALAAAEPAP